MKVLELKSVEESEGESSGEREKGLSSNERFWPLSETAPNPLLTPLHVGHFCDKPNNGEDSPFHIALHCRCTLMQLLTNTKKGSHRILGRKQFQF